MDTSKFISSFYYAKVGSQIDPKQLRYWETCITNNAGTLDDFKDFVLTSTEYSGALQKRFYDIYQSFVSDVAKDVVSNSYTVFWNKQLTMKEEVTEASIIHFIVNTKEFNEIYSNVIKDVVTFEFNRNATDDEVNFIMNRVKTTSALYTANNIAIDIANMKVLLQEAQLAASATHVTDIAVATEEEQDINPTDIIKQAFDIGMEKLEMFESVFKRPMYVQEFRKYILDTLDDMDWENLLETHSFNFNKLRRIYKDFTGKTMDEYYYVKNYLNVIDHELFFESFIENIINTKEYMTSMKKTITSKYLQYYDQGLEDNDIEYIFNIIKNKQLAIVDEEIDRIMTQVKTETDDIVANIFKVYKYTVDRPPEIQEIDSYTQMYRELNNMNIDDVNGKLEVILINNLEFHDIIKTKLKQHNEHLTTTKLYALLNVVIKYIKDGGNEVTIKGVDNLISELSSQ